MLTKKRVLGTAVIVMMCIGGLGISGLLHFDNLNPSPKETCGNLPEYLQGISPKPDDFDFALRKMRKEADICEVSEAYYLQPDFYGESWEDGKHQYDEHDYSRWLVYGYGAYPASPKATFSSNKVGEEEQICTLYRTGWGVETWQGIKLVPEKSKYFEVVIDPDEFLLPPTFPNFDRGWVKKLNITVRIKQTPSVGTYNIVVNAVSPSEEKSKKWESEVLKKNISIRRMLEECIMQNIEKELNLKCEELIRDRRNKYVESGNINVGERLTIMINFKQEKRN